MAKGKNDEKEKKATKPADDAKAPKAAKAKAAGKGKDEAKASTAKDAGKDEAKAKAKPEPKPEPEAAKPEATKPEATKPEAAKPEAAKPEAAKPEPPKTQPAAPAAAPPNGELERWEMLPPRAIDTSVTPSTPAPAPGRAPRGDARSMRRADEFCMIYRHRVHLIRRQGKVGQTGEWIVTEYPSMHSAAHAYAQECSDLAEEGFVDIR